MSMSEYHEIPDHVRRIIDRDGEIEFTPPSFERWLGRLQILRTLASMGAFLLVWLVTYGAGQSWEGATLRGMIASIVSFFFAWAAGLFVFGELYDGEVKRARVELEEKERERARRIEAYYRERLRLQAEDDDGTGVATIPGGSIPATGEQYVQAPTTSLHAVPPAPGASDRLRAA